MPAAPQLITHYRVVRELGRGGMGVVYLAEDTLLGRHVAIKFLPGESAADPHARGRLVEEARAAANLEHPNICSVHEVGEEAGRAFIVMEYVEGQTLAARLGGGPLGLGECLEVAAQVADALAEAHARGVVHRDVSPQNIMLTARGRAVVMDFGLAKVIRDRSLVDSEAVTESLLPAPAEVAVSALIGNWRLQGCIALTKANARLIVSSRQCIGFGYAHQWRRCIFIAGGMSNDGIHPELNADILAQVAFAEAQFDWLRCRLEGQRLAELRPRRRIDRAPFVTNSWTSMNCLNQEQPVTALIPAPRGRQAWALLLALTIFTAAPCLAKTRTIFINLPARAERGGGGTATLLAPTAPRRQAVQQRPGLIVQTGHPLANSLAEIISSPDGKLLAATAFGSGEVRLWETSTGRELRVFRAGGRVLKGKAPAVAFSGDGRMLAVAGSGGAIRLWDVLNGREVRAPAVTESTSGRGTSARLLALDGDGSTLVFIDGEIKVWDGKTGRWRRVGSDTPACGGRKKTPFPARGADFAFSPDGSQVVQVLSEPGEGGHTVGVAQITDPARWGVDDFRGRVRAMFVDVASGCESRSFELQDVTSYEGLSAAAVAYTPAGGALIAGVDGRTLKLWDIQAGGSPRALSGNSYNSRPVLSFSPGGRFLAASDGAGIRVWETATGREVRSFSLPGGATAKAPQGHALAVGTDGQWVAAAGGGSAITVWDTATGKLARRLSGTGNPAYEVRFTPDGRGLLSGGRTRWDLKEGVASRLVSDANAGDALPSPDGVLLAGISRRGDAITISEAGTGRRLHSLGVPKESPPFLRLAFGAGGRMLAAIHAPRDLGDTREGAAAGSLLSLWDVRTGRKVHTFFCSGGAEDARFSEDGNYLAVADSLAKVTLWDLRTGRELVTFDSDPQRGQPNLPVGSSTEPVASGRVTAPVDFSPDGRLLAAGAVLREVASGRTVETFPLEGGGARQVAFSADVRLLAVATADNSIKVFDLRERREVLTLSGHTADVNSLAFSADGAHIASASDDGSTYLWDAKTGDHLATLVSLFDGGDWLVITPDGLFDGTPHSWNQILWRYDEDTFNVAPVEWFFNEFYYPGLLAEIFAGKRPQAPESFERKARHQPQITLSLAGGQSEQTLVPDRHATVRILVEAEVASGRGSSGARDLRLFRNGSLVRVWRGDVLRGRRTAVLETSIPLVAGENRLLAYAFNKDNVKSRDAQLTITGGDALRREGVTNILAVGVNNYADPRLNLRYAVADARAFTEEVSRQQERAGLGKARVVSLFDGGATKESILRALTDLASEVQPEDTLVVYFAGHGLARGNSFYILPHDLGDKGGSGTPNEAALETIVRHSISDRELEAAFEKVDAGRLLLVIDACNSGQALESEESRRGPMNSKGLAQLAYEKGMYVLAAAQSYQAALEASELGHGLLTYALVMEGLITAAADMNPRDGEILAREWFSYAVERVPQMQLYKIAAAQKAGRDLFFREEERGVSPELRSGQQPRLFFRREVEAKPVLVARPGPR